LVEPITPKEHIVLGNQTIKVPFPIDRRHVEESIRKADPVTLFAETMKADIEQIKPASVLRFANKDKKLGLETVDDKIFLTDSHIITDTTLEEQADETKTVVPPEAQIIKASFAVVLARFIRNKDVMPAIDDLESVDETPKEINLVRKIATSTSTSIRPNISTVMKLVESAPPVGADTIIAKGPKPVILDKEADILQNEETEYILTDDDPVTPSQEIAFLTRSDVVDVVDEVYDLTNITDELMQPASDIFQQPTYENETELQSDVPDEPIVFEVEAFAETVPEIILSDNLIEQLVEALQGLEPELIEIVQPILTVINRTAQELSELPVSEEGPLKIIEQDLEEWCVRFLSSLDIKPSAQTVNEMISLIISKEYVEAAQTETSSIEILNNEGTREYKSSISLATFTNLIHSLKQKVHLSTWLGRYTLQVIAI
jgi:hypothetical protein